MRLCRGAVLAMILWGTGLPGFARGGQEVNIYSHRHYAVDRQLYKRFEETTGIRVNVVQAEADELIQRLAAEGQRSPADILMTVDAGRLGRAADMGLLKPITSEILQQRVPAHLRDPAGRWYALTRRVRLLVYHPDRVSPEELSTYEALADPMWRGRILVRSSSNIYNQSLLASMIAVHGEAAALEWAAGLVANFARQPAGSDRDQMKAIMAGAGAGDVAIVNSYYVGLLAASDDPEERRVAQTIRVFFPNQSDRGAHVNVSGAGVTASSRNTQNALRLLEFLVSREAQLVFAAANYEYALDPQVAPPRPLAGWPDFLEHQIDLSQYTAYNTAAVRIFDQVGWR